jgi:FlaA1/EpsC-like NDP-sugar epimerase
MTEFDSLSGKKILVVGGAGLLGKEFCNEIFKSLKTKF